LLGYSLFSKLQLVDLRKPPIDLNAAVNGPAGAGLGGLLSAFGGASGSGSGSSEAKKAATDLTGLVRKKAKDVPAPAPASAPAAAPAADASATNGKRKAEEPADGSDEEAKKARTVDAA
jgi:HAT1-interacting factor 1